MLKLITRKIIDIIQWFFDSVLPNNIQVFIKGILSENQKRYIKNLFKNGKRQKQIKKIETIKYKLYNLGFTKKAYSELNDLLMIENDPYLQKLAAWELALWHANKYSLIDAEKCIELLEIVKKGKNNNSQLQRIALLEVESYEVLGELDKAKLILNNALLLGKNPDLYLAAANLETSLPNRLVNINKALELFNVDKISLKSTNCMTIYDALHTEIKNNEIVNIEKVKVSIIVPVYNAKDVIATSLESLLSQTWVNMEVIIVDDCSTDDSIDLLEEYVKKDPRVKLIKAKNNGGAYVSRNLALQSASGDFVTINDADDWSHPKKIEIQALHLIENPSIIGNTSQQARATEELKFYRRGKPGYYIFNNMSSFMFRKTPVLGKLGSWDSVRFGADSEFIIRIKKVFGEKSVVELPTGPLSFQRQSKNSLTGDSVFGFPGYFMGARKEYVEAQRYYHKNTKSLFYNFPQEKRPFPVPWPMLPSHRGSNSERRHFDIIIVSDFRLDGGSTISSIEEIKAQKLMGLTTGLIQLARYDYPPRKRVNPKVRELIDGEHVQMIVYGEKVECEHLILRYPPILQEMQRFVPDVYAKKISVIINQTPLSDYGENAEIRYDLHTCAQRVIEYFGKSADWYPIGPLVREALHTYHDRELEAINLSIEDWPNIINVNEWKREYRPNNRTAIKIGRHSRGQFVKWPNDPQEIKAIYPESDNYEIHVLGGAEIPKKVLGYIPLNWKVYEFGEVDPKVFLATLDFFVYYTHPNWVESFGRVILEAMAVGVPVIISPKYKSLFGEAAIYADPQEVETKMQQYMVDENSYNDQVEKARKFVDNNFGYTQHFNRIQSS